MGTKGRICLEPAEPIREAAGNVMMELGKRVLQEEEGPEQCRGLFLPLLDSPGPTVAPIPTSLPSVHPSIRPSLQASLPSALAPGGACRRGMDEQTGAFTPLSPVNLPQPRESRAGPASTARTTGIKLAKTSRARSLGKNLNAYTSAQE